MRKAYIIGILLIIVLLVLGACAPAPEPEPAPPEESLAAPKLLSPHNGATDIELSPILLWESVPEAEGYELRVSRNSDFSDAVINETFAKTSYEFLGYLSPLTRYYWMVGAKMHSENPDAPVAYSEVWTFTTAEVSTSELPLEPPPLPEPPPLSSEPVKITAAQLSTEYDEYGASVAAIKYKDQYLEVSGTFDYLDYAIGKPYLSFEVSADAWEIRAFPTDDQVSKATELSKGDKITVIGICQGIPSGVRIVLGDCRIIVP